MLSFKNFREKNGSLECKGWVQRIRGLENQGNGFNISCTTEEIEQGSFLGDFGVGMLALGMEWKGGFTAFPKRNWRN